MSTPKLYRLPDNTKPVIEECLPGGHWRPVAWVPADDLREAREILEHFSHLFTHAQACICVWCERRREFLKRTAEGGDEHG